MRSLLGALLAVVAVAAVIGFAREAAGARRGAAVALRALDSVAADASELASLRAATTRVAGAGRPAPGLAGQVSDTLAEAGVSIRVLRDFSADADRPGAAAGERRQSARFTLEPVSLSELGRFLAAWQSRRPEWSVASIQFAPQQSDRAAGVPQLQCRLVVEALYVEPNNLAERTR